MAFGGLMYTPVRPYTAGLAAASAGILTLSLVTAPPNIDVAVSPAEVHAVQLAAVTAADIPTVAVNAAASVPTPALAPGPVAAATPRADASLPAPQDVLASILANKWGRAALVLALTPIWYAGFPVVLPVAVFVLYSLQQGQRDPLTALVFGTAVYVAGPLAAIYVTVSALFASPASATAAANSTSSPTTNPSVSPQVTRNERRGIASPRRSTAASARAVAAATVTGQPKADASVGAEQGTPNTTGAEQGHRGVANSVNAADAKNSASNRPSTGNSSRGNSRKGRPN